MTECSLRIPLTLFGLVGSHTTPYGTVYTFLPEPTIQVSVEVNELVSNNVSKDRSFQRYLIFHILTKPDRVTLPQKGNILGKNPLPILLFTYYSLKIKFVPFLESQPATIPCKRKTTKSGAREKDRNRFAKNKN